MPGRIHSGAVHSKSMIGSRVRRHVSPRHCADQTDIRQHDGTELLG
jgi:hypothetical protein